MSFFVKLPDGSEKEFLRFYVEQGETLTEYSTLKRLDGSIFARKPVITLQPAGGTITDIENITLSVAADGLGSTMSYQWYKSDGTLIDGATNTTYDFVPTEIGNFGFFCRVNGFGGYTQTNTANVVVESAIAAPVITSGPNGGQIYSNGSHTASVTINWGGQVGTVVWYLAGVAQANSNSASFTFSGMAAGSHTIYCEATNPAGSVTSSTATINVLQSATNSMVVGQFSQYTYKIYGYGSNMGSLSNRGVISGETINGFWIDGDNKVVLTFSSGVSGSIRVYPEGMAGSSYQATFAMNGASERRISQGTLASYIKGRVGQTLRFVIQRV